MCLAEPPGIPGIPVKRLDAEWLGGCPIGDPKDQGRLKIHVLIAWSKETVEQSKGASSLFNDKHSLLYFVTAQISTAQTTVPNFSLPTLLHTTLHYYITTLTFPPIEPNTSVWISTTSLYMTPTSSLLPISVSILPFTPLRFAYLPQQVEKWSRACSSNRILEAPATASTIKQTNWT